MAAILKERTNMDITPLTEENYYTKEIDKEYMSVSQFKDFAGTIAKPGCERTAMKKLTEDIPEKKTTSLLVGSYIDAYFEGTLDKFKEENPEIFKKTGDKGLLKDYVLAQDVIGKIESDNLFREFMSGQKQVIMSAWMMNSWWKIKIDSYHQDKIVDLKVMKDMNAIWSNTLHKKIDFIRYWGYDIQGAVYQEVVRLQTGKKLPFYLAVATKENPCDIEIIEITQPYLDEALKFVNDNIEHVLSVKNGLIEPARCGNCFYCKTDKHLIAPITIDRIIPKEDRLDAPNAAPMTGFTLFE